MTRLQSTLLAALFALVGVGALIWIATQAPSSSQRAKARYDDDRPFAFGPDDVAFGTVTSTHGAWRFERDEVFGWRIAQPIDWPAHAEPLEALLVRVAGMTAARTVYQEPSAGELEQSGLREPRVAMALTLASGDEHRLEIGKSHPLEQRVYARADGGPVFVTDPSVLWASLRPAEEFRKKRILPFDRAKVEALSLRRADGRSWKVESAEDGFRLSVDGGPFHPADPGQVAVAMAAAFLRLEADRWLVDGAEALGPALREQGASSWKPAFSLSVRHESGLVRTATVVVASRRQAAAPQPLAWVDGSLVELYAPPAKDLLTLDPLLLRDRQLAEFEPQRVDKIFLIYGAELATLSRGEPSWTLERSSGGVKPVGAKDVEALLERLANLEGTALVSEAPTVEALAGWMLQPPSRRFGLQDADGETLGVITLGDVEDEVVYVRGGTGPVWTVPTKSIKKVPTQLSDF